jgi:hypothetical protein
MNPTNKTNKRKQCDIANEVPHHQAEAKIAALKRIATMDEMGCWILGKTDRRSGKATTSQGGKNTDGYRQVWLIPEGTATAKPTGRSAQRAYLLHKLSMYAYHVRLPEEGEQASHLCNKRECFNPDHLVAESIKTNNSRKGCPGDISCSHCTQITWSCPHNPKCVN